MAKSTKIRIKICVRRLYDEMVYKLAKYVKGLFLNYVLSYYEIISHKNCYKIGVTDRNLPVSFGKFHKKLDFCG